MSSPNFIPYAQTYLNNLSESGGGKKGGKKKGGSMQTVSSQFRVRYYKQFLLKKHIFFSFPDKSYIFGSTGELGQADDKLEEHTPSLCALSDSQ